MKFFKKVLFLAAALQTFSFNAYAAETQPIKVFFNNTELHFQQNAEIINGRTMVPMRTIFTKLGYEIYWNDVEKSIVATKNDSTLKFNIGSDTAYKNGESFTLDSPAIIKNDYTLVPLRYVAESADCNVEWNGDKKEIYISSASVNTATDEIDPITLCDSVVEIDTDTQQGSGIIINENGYIATNFHVVQGAKYIRLFFNDGSLYFGKVTIVGHDIPSDIVVLKIDKNNLKSVKLRDSSTILPNEEVITIGTPEGHFNTISTGAIKGFTSSTISTSAPIYPGSSGGGLFDKKGNLIGMMSSFDTDKNYMAIPSNFIANLPLNLNIPLSQWQNVTPVLVPPDKIEININNNNEIKIFWDSVFGADGYHVYYSDKENGEYKKMTNNSDNPYLWHWAYPNCFTIKQLNKDMFIKVSTVIGNKESQTTNTYKITVK